MSNHIQHIMTTMRKLILLIAVATTISFAACNNAKTTEQPEEVAIENAEVALEEAVAAVDSATLVVEEAAEALTETVD